MRPVLRLSISSYTAWQRSSPTRRNARSIVCWGSQRPQTRRTRPRRALLDFFRFAAYPPEARAKHILTSLAQYAELRPLHLEGIHHAGMSPELLQRLSTA